MEDRRRAGGGGGKVGSESGTERQRATALAELAQELAWQPVTLLFHIARADREMCGRRETF